MARQGTVQRLGERDFVYLGGQGDLASGFGFNDRGDLVSMFAISITGDTIWLIGVISILTKS